jgi:hypothetical protein
LNTDWLFNFIGDNFAYFAHGHSEDAQMQTSLATIVIGENINEPEISNTTATTHRNYRTYIDTRFSTSETTFFVNTRVQPDPQRTHKPLFVSEKQISRKVLHLWA